MFASIFKKNLVKLAYKTLYEYIYISDMQHLSSVAEASLPMEKGEFQKLNFTL